jgi:hypothetical protein
MNRGVVAQSTKESYLDLPGLAAVQPHRDLLLLRRRHMNWFWILVAMPLASLLCFVYMIGRLGGRIGQSYTGRFAKEIVPIALKSGLLPQSKRKICWMSAREFEALVQRSDDVIVIDLCSNCTDKPIGFHAPHVLLIQQRGLLDVLQWSPSSSSVVLYGPHDVCASTIPTIRKVSGSAPVYLLPESLNNSRVA